MMGEDENAAEDMAETAAPTLEVNGDLATALTDGRQEGEEFTATVKFRVASVGEGGEATLEVLDAQPQDTGEPQDGAAAVDSFLAAGGGAPPAQ